MQWDCFVYSLTNMTRFQPFLWEPYNVTWHLPMSEWYASSEKIKLPTSHTWASKELAFREAEWPSIVLFIVQLYSWVVACLGCFLMCCVNPKFLIWYNFPYCLLCLTMNRVVLLYSLKLEDGTSGFIHHDNWIMGQLPFKRRISTNTDGQISLSALELGACSPGNVCYRGISLHSDSAGMWTEWLV